MNWKEKFLTVALSFLVWGTPLFFLSVNSHFVSFFGKFHLSFTDYVVNGIFAYSTQGILFEILCLSSFVFFCVPSGKKFAETRVVLIFEGFKKLLKWIFSGKLQKSVGLLENEKVSMLFWVVKFCFLPLLVHFSHQNIINLSRNISFFSGDFSSLLVPEVFLTFTFPFLFTLFLSIDTFYFVFGYLVESKFLKNEVKSVDATFLGWFFALACYPPYNFLTTKFLGWYSSDFGTASDLLTNYFLSIVAIAFFGIYVLATINLGTKCSNMTNRGIVSSGVYSIVRHPAYISKTLAWWTMGIPFIDRFGWVAVASLLAWSFVYYMRAMTEERHLSQDPDYVKYQQKVKWKFVPFVW